MRRLKKFDVVNLSKESGQTTGLVRDQINRLVLSGHIEKKTVGVLESFVLVKDSGAQRPIITRKGKQTLPTKIQKMWITMKVLKIFTAVDLSLASEVKISVTKSYISFLIMAGYIKRQPGSSTKRIPSLYRFIPVMDSGPRAPVVYKGDVYDYNKKAFTYVRPTKVAA